MKMKTLNVRSRILPSYSLMTVALVFAILCAQSCKGQYREVLELASHAASTMGEVTSEVVKEGEGTFIRTAYKDGCLDAGCCLGFQSQVRFNENCPSWGWLKWTFNGPMLVSHRFPFHVCLDCQYGEENCLITSSSCKGKHSQFWYLDTSVGQRNARGEVLFTIVNPMYPKRCITIDKVSLTLHLRPCDNPSETQLFYISRNWITDVKKMAEHNDRHLESFRGLMANEEADR